MYVLVYSKVVFLFYSYSILPYSYIFIYSIKLCTVYSILYYSYVLAYSCLLNSIQFCFVQLYFHGLFNSILFYYFKFSNVLISFSFFFPLLFMYDMVYSIMFYWFDGILQLWVGLFTSIQFSSVVITLCSVFFFYSISFCPILL